MRLARLSLWEHLSRPPCCTFHSFRLEYSMPHLCQGCAPPSQHLLPLRVIFCVHGGGKSLSIGWLIISPHFFKCAFKPYQETRRVLSPFWTATRPEKKGSLTTQRLKPAKGWGKLLSHNKTKSFFFFFQGSHVSLAKWNEFKIMVVHRLKLCMVMGASQQPACMNKTGGSNSRPHTVIFRHL